MKRGRFPRGEAIVVDVNRIRTINTYLRHYTNIKDVVIIGHSSSEGIYVGADPQRGTNISNVPGRNNAPPSSINWSNVDGTVRLWGCNAGRGPNSIAQSVATASQRRVEAYTNYVNLGSENSNTYTRGNYVNFGSNGPTVFTNGNIVRLLSGNAIGGLVEFEP
jgi:hypothetical protein